MAKKQVDVNEEMLKDIIAGDVPVFKKEMIDKCEKPSGIPPAHEEEDSSVPSAEEPEDKPSGNMAERRKVTGNGKARPRRNEPSNYRERFLACNTASNRAHVYLNRDMFERIKRFLPVIAPRTSISGYICNILEDHLDRYRDEIKEMYDNEFHNQNIF